MPTDTHKPPEKLTTAEQFELANLLIRLKAPFGLMGEYTNRTGDTLSVRLSPIGLWYGVSDGYVGSCLYLRAIDLDTGQMHNYNATGFDMKTLTSFPTK
jgi:hypothetical protein